MIELLQALRHRMVNMLRRAGVVTMSPRAGGDLPRVQVIVMASEVKDGVPVLMPFGFAARVQPASGGAASETLMVELSPNHLMALPPSDRRFAPPDLQPGEVAIYDDLGQFAHLKRDGIVAYSPQNILLQTDGILRLDADGVEIHGRTYVQTDVHGKGQRETHAGGTDYYTDSYTTGATSDGTEHGLDQPAIPSGHPFAAEE